MTATVRAASQTALLAAACRRRATERANPLCSDPWAGALAGEEGEAFLDELLRAAPTSYPPDDELVGLRTGYFDACVLQGTQISNAFRQVVILGAGLDTRAARLGCAGVTYYEVDHPESQAYKLQRLRELGRYPVHAAQYVACDFERADHLDMLFAAGLRADEPTLFVMEGVVHYLTEALVKRTLEPIARRCDPKSTVVFDYLSSRLEEDQDAFEVGEKRGEPVLWTSENPLPLLHAIGFRHVRTTPFDQIFASMTGESCARRSFIHTCFFARATGSTPQPPYLW